MASFVRFLTLILLLVASWMTRAQDTSPASPASIPLVLRSPYLNTWVNGGELTRSWATFWNQRVSDILTLMKPLSHCIRRT